MQLRLPPLLPLAACPYPNLFFRHYPSPLCCAVVYYMLRERQLAYNIRSTVAEGPAELLQRRSLPALSVNVPLASSYGTKHGDWAVYVRTIEPASCSLPLATPGRSVLPHGSMPTAMVAAAADSAASTP